MLGCELGSQSKPISTVNVRCWPSFHVHPPHFVAFLGFKDFEDLFGLGFGGISHGCAGVWVSLVEPFGVVDVEGGSMWTS